MEEAYNELYQQFLLLKSLCLRQAALLHQLSTAQQKQQGATIPNGVINDANDIPEYLQGKFELSLGATQCGVNGISGNIGTIADPLSMDMSQLSVNGACQKNENRELAQNIAPLQSLDSLRVQGASSKVSENYQADHHSGGRMRMPVTNIADDFPSQFEGMFSDVALQSQVCEFCQAVFPGDTTTRGAFLRHLYTHVT